MGRITTSFAMGVCFVICSCTTSPKQKDGPQNISQNSNAEAEKQFLKDAHGYQEDTRLFLERARRVAKPHELQSWAGKILGQKLAESNSGIAKNIPQKEWPKFIQKLGGTPLAVSVIFANKKRSAHVACMWGGGMGGFHGLVIGSSTFRPGAGDDDYTLEWIPGIYAFHSSH